MKIPFLKNFRRGFATNSSSSHSFVYLKKEGELGAVNPGSHLDSGFGWEDFRLDTIREKLFYVLVGRIGGGWDQSSDGSTEFQDLGEDFPELTEDDFRAAVGGYIDHDSVGTIGADMARDPHVVVFGGNDNEGESEERAAAVRNKEVDWSKTDLEYYDLPHIQADDEEGQLKVKEYLKENPWASRF